MGLKQILEVLHRSKCGYFWDQIGKDKIWQDNEEKTSFHE